MGRAAAIAFARERADVAINYLPAEEPDAREVVDLIREAGRTAVPLPGDLRDEAFCQDLVAKAVEGLGGLHIVICNAGRQQSRESILDLTTDDFDATMKTNVYAPFWIIKAACFPPPFCQHLTAAGARRPKARGCLPVLTAPSLGGPGFARRGPVTG